MKNIVIAIISLGSAGFGAILAYFFSRKLIRQTDLNARKLIEINYANSLQLLQKTEFNKTSAEFRCAFTREYGDIIDMKEGGDGTEIETILTNAYVHHRNALIRFKVYLSASQRTAIDKTWDDYCYGENIPGDGKSERFEQYKFDISQFIEKKQLAVNNLNHILSFAELK